MSACSDLAVQIGLALSLAHSVDYGVKIRIQLLLRVGRVQILNLEFDLT